MIYIKADALKDGLYQIQDGYIHKYKAKGGTVRTYPIVSAEAVQGEAISKRFISDAILQKISELNAQGEKAIPIAREFIRFKRFVDGITPMRAGVAQGEWKIDEYGIYHCPYCHAINNTVYKSFCPNCGADMRKENKQL